MQWPVVGVELCQVLHYLALKALKMFSFTASYVDFTSLVCYKYLNFYVVSQSCIGF